MKRVIVVDVPDSITHMNCLVMCADREERDVKYTAAKMYPLPKRSVLHGRGYNMCLEWLHTLANGREWQKW